jgi:hypothetical protein
MPTYGKIGQWIVGTTFTRPHQMRKTINYCIAYQIQNSKFKKTGHEKELSVAQLWY